ncbi:pyridoxamine 5'-phosphate oxidase family protein [Roseomonas fluvialis]|uniref:Pyridoxamine 5'-phosphate oxidase n=1 Tax=Roseomonas fluvialis TaxID=1750527 RepID=A0ABN6P3B0_9PROT|nr:pyridoxamine 5'-phosphate oxidase family protein [Roseomonas fluvialis]BDG72198.1 pyridoxamine 5'-phosphate oxidase [Roseomonas fluvialis]
MTRPAPPATPQEALAQAFALLSRGVADRRSPFHTPTLATRGLDGAPSLRTVVLRAFDPAARLLRVHTDRRSGKVGEIAADPRAALHVYDAGAQVQLRVAGITTLHVDDAVAQAAWTASREMSRMTYATLHAPGAPVDAPPDAPQDATAGAVNFAALSLRIDAMDWLLLAAAGHRRARFAWDPDGVLSAGWIAP